MTPMLFYNNTELAGKSGIRNPPFDCIVEDYCGISLSELEKKSDSQYETEAFWAETNAEPTVIEKLIIEMLHLAYTRGGEL